MAAVMRRVFGALCAVTIVVAVAACTDTSAPSDSPTPAPTTTPVFSSDKEALAAAKKAYAKYLKVSDEIAHDGGKDPERIKAVVTSDWAADELSGFDHFAAKGYRQIGDTKYDHVRFQERKLMPNGKVSVSIYVCSDSSETQIVDATGASVTPPDRPLRVPLVATFLSRGESHVLVLERYEPWAGKSFC